VNDRDLNGITVNGEDIKSVVERIEDGEKTKEVREIYKKVTTQMSIARKPPPIPKKIFMKKEKSEDEKNSRVRRLTMAERNLEYKEAISKARNQSELVMAVLLTSNKELRNREIATEYGINLATVMSCLTKWVKSPLRFWLNVEKRSQHYDSTEFSFHREVSYYKLKDSARNMTLDIAMKFVSKRYKDVNLLTIGTLVPQMKEEAEAALKYLEVTGEPEHLSPIPRGGVKTESGSEIPKSESDGEISKTPDDAETTSSGYDTLRTFISAIENLRNINVNVKVEISFKQGGD